MATRRENAAIVRELQARGWTQRQIAQATGRSPSYISRVARGLTPGRSIDAPLRTLTRRRRVPEPGERPRPVAGLTPARPGRRIQRTPSRDYHPPRRSDAAIRRALESSRGRTVYPLFHSSSARGYARKRADGTVEVALEGGVSADRLLAAIDAAGGDVRAGLLGYVNDSPLGPELADIIDVQITAERGDR